MKPWLRNSLLAAAGVVLVGVLSSRCTPAPPPENDAPSETVSSLSVEVVKPQRQQWPGVLQASGALAAWQEAVINAETSGLRIASLNADVGSQVKKGQVLATLAPETVQAQEQKQLAAVAQARANLEEARSNDRRANVVGQGGSLSDQQREQYRIQVAVAKAALASAEADLRATRINLGQTRILAVDDGVISSRTALLGKVLAAGDELFRLIRGNRIEWQAELDARQLSQVRIGQVARVQLPDGQQVTGQVRLVSPVLDAKTSRALVYVALPVGSPAQAGMYASGRIDLPTRDALTLPDSAVVLRDGRSYVFSVGADQHVKQQLVTLGRRQQQAIEVLSGLDADTPVVRSGGAFLADGAKVTVVPAEGATP